MRVVCLIALLLSGCYEAEASCEEAAARAVELGCVAEGWVENFEANFPAQCEANGADATCFAMADDCDELARCANE